MAGARHVAWLKTHVGSRAQARRLAREALDRRLAACANLTAVESLYWWRGRIESAGEVAVVFKTDRRQLGKLRAFVEERHPYDVPYVAWGAAEPVPAAYARWATAETAGRQAPRGRAGRRGATPRTR